MKKEEDGSERERERGVETYLIGLVLKTKFDFQKLLTANYHMPSQRLSLSFAFTLSLSHTNTEYVLSSKKVIE